MKKLFKRASLILLTVCTVFACAFALSACSKNYTFSVKNSDGSAFTQTGVSLQICVEETGACYPITEYALDANGNLTLSQKQINELCSSETDVTKFDFHVWYAEGYAEDCKFAIDGAKEYTLKLYV